MHYTVLAWNYIVYMQHSPVSMCFIQLGTHSSSWQCYKTYYMRFIWKLIDLDHVKFPSPTNCIAPFSVIVYTKSSLTDNSSSS